MTVYDLGAEVAGSAADAARRAGIVVTMVTDADAVMLVALDQGMLATLAPGAIWAQMSTIGVAGTDRVAAMAGTERPDVMLLDAPVSGSKDPAERGQLTIFASGPDEARPRVAPLFDALGQRTIWVGEAGAGTRLKLVNNTWLAFAADESGAHQQLDRFIEAGGTLVDTADVYGGGRSEEIIGRWFASRPADVTGPVVLATKGRMPVDDSPNGAGLSARHLARALEASLRRLGLETVDLYQVHAYEPLTPLEETLRTIEGFIQAGKIRYWGCPTSPAGS